MKDRFLEENGLDENGNPIRKPEEIQAEKDDDRDDFLKANRLGKDGNPLPGKEGEDKPKFVVSVLGRKVPV